MIDWQAKANALKNEFAKTTTCKFGGNADKIVIACSGGADSLCALLLTWATFPRERAKMLVAHLNHETRGNASDGDDRFVARVAKSLNLKFVSAKLSDFVPAGTHTEAHFRQARLDFFASLAGGNAIFVQGHHADDVVETMIMRLARGSGVDGLCAPRPISEIVHNGKKLIFVRPFLQLPKAKIVAALRACKINWREDKSNCGNDFFRNRVRHFVVPALKKALPNNYDLYTCFLRSREQLQSVADTLPKHVPATKKNVPARTNFFKKFDAITLDSERGFCGNGIKIEFVKLTKKLRERICAGKEKPAEFLAVPAGTKLVLRNWKKGDRMQMLGAAGTKTLGNLFTDKKIPREQRENAPVLVCGNAILWCAGLPIADFAKLVPATKTCLKININEKMLD